MPGTPAPTTRPLASTVMVLMLAFSLSIIALLAYLGSLQETYMNTPVHEHT